MKNGFKETEIGDIPVDWEVVRLEEVAKNYDKQRIPLSKNQRQTMSGSYPYCGANGIIDFINDYIFDGEFVLLSEDGGYWGAFENSAYIMNGKFWVNNHAHILKAVSGKTINHFLMYVINFLDISIFIAGTTRGKLNQGVMKNIPIPLPPLPEQRKVANVLSTIQQAIEQQDKILASVRELKKTLMRKLFTEGLGDAELKETEIGTMPKHWDVVRLGEVGVEFFGGGTPSTKKPEYWNGDIPWTTSAHINGLYLQRGAKNITHEGLSNSASRLVLKNNLLIGTRVGVGKVAINLIDVAISQDLTGMIVDKEKANLEFLAYALSSDIIQDIFHSCTRGTTIKGIPRDDLIQIPTPLPPLPEQQEIARILSTVDKKIEVEENRKWLLQELFKTMLHKLMTGQIRVKDLDLEV